MRITLVIKAWKKKKYKPIYTKQNHKNIYTSAMKI